MSGTAFAVDIPAARSSSRQEARSRFSKALYIPDRVDPQQGVITYTATGATPTVLELLDHEPLGYLRAVGMKPDFLGGTAEGNFTLNFPRCL